MHEARRWSPSPTACSRSLGVRSRNAASRKGMSDSQSPRQGNHRNPNLYATTSCSDTPLATVPVPLQRLSLRFGNALSSLSYECPYNNAHSSLLRTQSVAPVSHDNNKNATILKASEDHSPGSSNPVQQRVPLSIWCQLRSSAFSPNITSSAGATVVREARLTVIRVAYGSYSIGWKCQKVSRKPCTARARGTISGCPHSKCAHADGSDGVHACRNQVSEARTLMLLGQC